MYSVGWKINCTELTSAFLQWGPRLWGEKVIELVFDPRVTLTHVHLSVKNAQYVYTVTHGSSFQPKLWLYHVSHTDCLSLTNWCAGHRPHRYCSLWIVGAWFNTAGRWKRVVPFAQLSSPPITASHVQLFIDFEEEKSTVQCYSNTCIFSIWLQLLVLRCYLWTLVRRDVIITVCSTEIWIQPFD
jgi:hypothetical protein